MPNTHGLVITTNCAFWDVDALNAAGVATVNIDNGSVVKLDSMNTATANGDIQGYEFNVSLATAGDKDVYVVKTPIATANAANIEAQIYSDPRYFYNVAGQPMSLGKLIPDVDCIEVDANKFTATPATGAKFAVIADNGLYTAQNEAPSTAGGYFEILGTKSVMIGMTAIPTWVMRYRVING